MKKNVCFHKNIKKIQSIDSSMKGVSVKIYIMIYEEINGKMKEIKKMISFKKMKVQSENKKMRKN